MYNTLIFVSDKGLSPFPHIHLTLFVKSMQTKLSSIYILIITTMALLVFSRVFRHFRRRIIAFLALNLTAYVFVYLKRTPQTIVEICTNMNSFMYFNDTSHQGYFHALPYYATLVVKLIYFKANVYRDVYNYFMYIFQILYNHFVKMTKDESDLYEEFSCQQSYPGK